MDESPILKPGQNCWKTARADRVSLLDDTAQYFEAVADALEAAESSVFIVGWDLHSKVILRRRDGDGRSLIDTLADLARRRPALMVRILVWDADFIYAAERENFQRWRFRLRTPSNVRFVIDESAPHGTSQHQKLVTVDDRLAFVGGVDLTQRRWDTRGHQPDDARRRTPYGLSYDPFHDCQVAVSGEAAAMVTELARWRWERATGERVASATGGGEAWPRELIADFEGVDVALARTLPRWMTRPPVREVEQLFFDALRAARRSIYLESQYISSSKIARVLEEVLARSDGPEVMLVLPREASGWVEQSTLDSLRASLLRRIRCADRHDRLCIVYPAVESAGARCEVYVHAKVCVIDDRLLRVGSANLTNRSLGVDSEADLVLEARDKATRRRILRVRNRLLGAHVGMSVDEVEEALSASGSLLDLVEARRDGPRRLVPLDPDEVSTVAEEWADERLMDPDNPLDAAHLADELLPESADRGRSNYARMGLLLGLLLLVAVVWRFSPLEQAVDPRLIAEAIEPLARTWWSVPAAIAAFVAASVLAFPTSVLILAMGFVFGALWGSIYALAGALLSALISFGLGRTLGAGAISRFAGDRIAQVHQWVSERGIWAVVALRMVPLGPFALVNMAVGASKVRYRDFAWGTALGMTPGIILKGVFGDELAEFLLHPTPGGLAVLAVLLVVFVGAGVLVARWVRTKGEASASTTEAGEAIVEDTVTDT